MNKDLSWCRARIDEIDEKLMALFEERMTIVLDVARYKKENNLPIFNKVREDEVIKKNLNRINNEALKVHAENMLHSLMDISKDYQCENIGVREVPLSKGREVKIGYQGVPGSFSDEALIKYFGKGYSGKAFEEFEDVFTALKFDVIDYGVLPIENSTTGSITKNYDLLKKYGFHIVGEVLVKIEHNLLGIKGSEIKDIEEIYSHSQAFEQSSEYLNSLGNKVQLIPHHNTATSAKYISELSDKRRAAIGSLRAAEIYGLDVLKEHINNALENYTRFIIVGRDFETNELCNKITISFTLDNKAGNLYNKLKVFSDNNINLRKIESRPMGNGHFDYYFYIDLDGNISDNAVKNSLDLLEKDSKDYRLLGAYRREE